MILVSRGNSQSLTTTESEDLLQLIMAEFFAKSKNFVYDNAKGRFRGYLKTIIQRRTVNVIKARPTPTCELLECDEIATDECEDENFIREWRLNLLSQALREFKDRVEPETYEAFYLYGYQQRNAAETASFLNMTVGSVYVAKNRCLKMLQEIVREMEKMEGERIL